MGFCSIAMAKIVGDSGLVIAVDLQQKMWDVLRSLASRGLLAWSSFSMGRTYGLLLSSSR